jgi:hypothetical protein
MVGGDLVILLAIREENLTASELGCNTNSNQPITFFRIGSLYSFVSICSFPKYF